jgi:hypothetical protein
MLRFQNEINRPEKCDIGNAYGRDEKMVIDWLAGAGARSGCVPASNMRIRFRRSKN